MIIVSAHRRLGKYGGKGVASAGRINHTKELKLLFKRNIIKPNIHRGSRPKALPCQRISVASLNFALVQYYLFRYSHSSQSMLQYTDSFSYFIISLTKKTYEKHTPI